MAPVYNMTTANITTSGTASTTPPPGLSAGVQVAIAFGVIGVVLAVFGCLCGNNILSRIPWCRQRFGELLQTSQGPQSIGITENQPLTSEEPTTQPATAQTTELVQTSQESGHSSIGIMENQPRTSQEPATQPAVAQTPAQAAADSCEEALEKRYRSCGSFVKMIPWVDDDKMHIMDIYTKLQLATEGMPTDLLDSYEDILSLQTREGDLMKRAILNGLAGRGKSTLFDKMAYDWAVKACAQRDFKLVILLKMCALDQTSELIDAIFGQLLDEDTKIDSGDLGVFIDKNPEKILILLDGFDELMTTCLCESSFGSILKILNKKICRECFVLVTTRPSHFDKLATNQLVQKPFTHVTVLGFNEKDVQDYVNKFYSEEHDKANGLLERIQSSQVLSTFAESPMLLLLMCLLWKEESTLPETTSCLYSEAVKYIFRRKVVDIASDKVFRIVTEMGKIGLDGLLWPSQVLSFKEKDFEKHAGMLDVGIKVGLLTRQRVLKVTDTHNSIQFIHNTFQEFCAAKYLQSLVEVDMKGFQESLDQMMRFPMVFKYLLRFCSGDSEVCTNKVIQALQESNQEELKFNEPLGQLALDCYFEGQSEQLPPETFIHSMITDSMQLWSDDRDCFNSSTYFLKRVADQTKSTGNTYLAKVVELDVVECNFEQFGASLAHTMSSMTNLQTLHFRSPHDSDVKHITLPLSSVTSVTELKLTYIDALSGSATFWFPFVKQMKGLRVLKLIGNSLTVEDMKHIVKSLSDLPNLIALSFARNDLGGSVALWVVHFQSLKRLQNLDFNHCSLTGEDMVHIVESLCDLPDLAELCFASNKKLSGSAALWSGHLKGFKQLKKLDVSRCSLTGDDRKLISESLSELSEKNKFPVQPRMF